MCYETATYQTASRIKMRNDFFDPGRIATIKHRCVAHLYNFFTTQPCAISPGVKCTDFPLVKRLKNVEAAQVSPARAGTMLNRINNAKLQKKVKTPVYAPLSALLIFLLTGHVALCQKANNAFSKQVAGAVFSLSRVMLHDVVNPPTASRYYAYCLLGAYEIVSQNDTSVPALSGIIKNYSGVAGGERNANYEAAAVYCILETGRLMLPSGYLLQEDENKLTALLQKQNLSAASVKQVVSVGADVARQVVAFSKSDHYNQLSARLRYTPSKKEGSWYPTPPAYIEAVEPNWKIIRPLFLDSCSEFKPAPPAAFSKDTASSFYKLAREVYDVAVKKLPEQMNIAAFWDCNPFAVATAGHMSIGFKKISPGGHWMNIAGIAAAKAHLSFSKTVLVHTLVATTLMDAFISCWDEKYRSNRIRPETYINRYMDVRWQPLLQTPPFPEYPSGHSVISTASAAVLTYLLGDHFSYTDDSEVIFDLPKRSFTSFNQAANEAAISRLYGGIHFWDAVEQGQWEGAAVGAKVVAKLKAAGVKPLR